MVITVRLSQLLEAAAVEVHAAEVEVVGIFFFAQAAGEEPELALGVIDMQDFADGPCAVCDLVFDVAGLGVVKVKVAPAVALAHPEEFVGGVQPVTPGFVGVVDEGFGGFFDDGAHCACLWIGGEDAVELVPALVVVEVELVAVGRPGDG